MDLQPNLIIDEAQQEQTSGVSKLLSDLKITVSDTNSHTCRLFLLILEMRVIGSKCGGGVMENLTYMYL